MTENFDEALSLIREAKTKKQPLSVGLLGNAADIIPKIANGKFLPDIVTDQTSAHDTLNGYVPAGLSYKKALGLRKKNPKKYVALAQASIGRACARNAEAFEEGRNCVRLRKQHPR